MSEPSSSDSANQHPEPGAGSTHPAVPSRWQQVKMWLLSVLIIVVVSAVVEKVFEHETLEYVKEVNESFVHHVKEVDPFVLAFNFYGYLIDGVPPQPKAPHLPVRAAFEIPQLPQSPSRATGVFTMLLRVIPGAYYTVLAIFSAGWVSWLTSITALFLGYCAVKSEIKSDEPPFILLAVPLIGCVLVWLLLQIMALTGWFFGELLAGAEMVAAFSVVPPVAWALVKKGEHDVTGKITKGLTGQH